MVPKHTHTYALASALSSSWHTGKDHKANFCYLLIACPLFSTFKNEISWKLSLLSERPVVKLLLHSCIILQLHLFLMTCVTRDFCTVICSTAACRVSWHPAPLENFYKLIKGDAQKACETLGVHSSSWMGRAPTWRHWDTSKLRAARYTVWNYGWRKGKHVGRWARNWRFKPKPTLLVFTQCRSW